MTLTTDKFFSFAYYSLLHEHLMLSATAIVIRKNLSEKYLYIELLKRVELIEESVIINYLTYLSWAFKIKTKFFR